MSSIKFLKGSVVVPAFLLGTVGILQPRLVAAEEVSTQSQNSTLSQDSTQSKDSTKSKNTKKSTDAAASKDTTQSQGNIELGPVEVVAARLDEARNGLSPQTGGSIYKFDSSDLASLPAGSNTSFNQVLLQAPGVVQDSLGELHVRGDHANLQYRINGIILPEGISGFGQALDTRFAKSIDLLTGALPAQYGYRTAGVVEITTKDQFKGGGRVSLYGGSHNTLNPSFEYGNTNGKFSYYLTGSFLNNDLGIENPTSSNDAIHDTTQQKKGFAYLSYLLDSDTRLSAMFGTYDGHFEIPNNPNQTADSSYLNFAGVSSFDSKDLNERQTETNRYGILALQSTIGERFDYQAALFTRDTSVHYKPDPIGDLVFNGVSSDVYRSSLSTGIQLDGRYFLNDNNIIRMGMMASTENVRSDNASTVFPVDSSGNVTGSPFTINDNHSKNGNTLFGLYLQNEWHPTDRLTINYGTRFDQVNAYVNESQLSPRLGMVFKATSKTTIHAGYARYFTPPPTELVSSSSLALFANTTNASEVTQNSTVKSERSNYFDVGATHQLTSELSFGIDSFYKKSTDLIDEGQFGQALVYTPFNYNQGKVYGYELTGNYKTDNLTAYVNFAHTVSLAKGVASGQFNFSQEELDYINTHWVHADHDQAYTASTGASYTWSGIRWNADAIFGSGLRSGFANTDHLPSYVQVNMGATKKFGSIETRLTLINVFDRVYKIRDGSGIGVGASQYGPRRGIYVGLTKTF